MPLAVFDTQRYTGKPRADATAVVTAAALLVPASKKSKSGAARRAGKSRPVRASSPAQPGRCCGVTLLRKINITGCLAKCAQSLRLQLRLVSTPLRPQALRPCGFTKPPLCLAPLALRVWHVARLAVAPSHTPDIHGVCGHGCAVTTGILARRFAQHHKFKARPPRAVCCAGLQQLRVFPPRTRRQALPKVKQPGNQQPARRYAPCSSSGTQPQPSLLARVQQRCQAVKAKPFGCCAALTACPRRRPCRS